MEQALNVTDECADVLVNGDDHRPAKAVAQDHYRECELHILECRVFSLGCRVYEP